MGEGPKSPDQVEPKGPIEQYYREKAQYANRTPEQIAEDNRQLEEKRKNPPEKGPLDKLYDAFHPQPRTETPKTPPAAPGKK